MVYRCTYGLWLAAALFSCAAVAAGADAGHWPSFRGPGGSGVAEGQNPPTQWDVETGVNIRWKTAIPGLGHSSPVIWGHHLFVTSAVTDREPYLRPGLYGESPDNPEEFTHQYVVYAVDTKTGRILWEQTAHSGIPKVKRHIKGSHANSSVATDGKHVVACFGSEGLYAYDLDGALLWKADLGLLDSGAFDAKEVQWGFGSSPIIHDGKVYQLCDANNTAFLAAFDVETGKELWRAVREEVPTWGTPAIAEVDGRTLVIVNGWKHIGAFDAQNGSIVWRMRGGGDIPVPTPQVAHGLVFITNAHGPQAPIYAVRLGARGEITLKENETSNEHVAWSAARRGAYIPTPLVYGEYLYVGNDRGILTCYKAATGEQVYRERIGARGGAYSASAVAAAGRLYYTSEEGNVDIVQAGPEYKHLATNAMGGVCLATPAIADDMLFIRTSTQLYGIGDTDEKSGVPGTARPASRPAEPPPTATQPMPQVVAAPAGDLTDPLEILKRANAALAAVQAVEYDVTVEATGALRVRVPAVRAHIIATGRANGWPEKYRVDGEAEMRGRPQPVQIDGGSDGNRYYVINYANRKVHADLEERVYGSLANALLSGIMREFHIPDSLGDEIKAKELKLLGTKDIGGEDCYEIRVAYADQQGSVATWYFAKKDLLPRCRRDVAGVLDDPPPEVVKTLTKLSVTPKLTAETFVFKVPEGFTRTEQPVP